MEASKLFVCQIITPERILYDGWVNAVQLCASKGRLEVRYGHEPFIATIVPGVVNIKGEKNEVLEVSSGVMLVEFDKCIIITTNTVIGDNT